MQTTTLSKKAEVKLKLKIQNFIIKNHKTMNNAEIAEANDWDLRKVSAMDASCKRRNLIPSEVVKKSEKVINKASDKYAEALEKSKSKKEENTFNNADGKFKKEAREIMVKWILASGIVGLVPTLCHELCEIEKMLLAVKKAFTFIGIEWTKKTLNIMRNTIRTEKLPFVETHHGKFSDKIYGMQANSYAHLIADYCGQLGTFAKEIEYAINNDIVQVNGILAFTFAKAIRGTREMDTLIKELGLRVSNDVYDNRCMSDRAIESYFDNVKGKNYEFVEKFNYQEVKPGEKTTPMTLVILRRIK